MMLEYMGWIDASSRIQNAIEKAISKKRGDPGSGKTHGWSKGCRLSEVRRNYS